MRKKWNVMTNTFWTNPSLLVLDQLLPVRPYILGRPFFRMTGCYIELFFPSKEKEKKRKEKSNVDNFMKIVTGWVGDKCFSEHEQQRLN